MTTSPDSTRVLSLAIASWGAVLSTALAAIKIWELWRERFRIEVNYSLTTNAEQGNRVSIHNLSGRPLILTYWELLYGADRWRQRNFEHVDCCDHGNSACPIEAYATHELHFVEDRHFAWTDKVLKGRKIYVRLHFAGRKPVVRLVYPRSSD